MIKETKHIDEYILIVAGVPPPPPGMRPPLPPGFMAPPMGPLPFGPRMLGPMPAGPQTVFEKGPEIKKIPEREEASGKSNLPP